MSGFLGKGEGSRGQGIPCPALAAPLSPGRGRVGEGASPFSLPPSPGKAQP